ncbi:MAG: TrmB family transcriptional regulator [Candidatus Aenigmarchaeota archaeon]|nr:TrmB family transcriptional regulator [Candidatus Aenigmarchaeota archaeon]
MVASTEVLDTLKSIGLNLYERKIFVALLAKGVATAAEVAELANVPRSRSYDVLESLAEKGFVVVQPSKPIKYVALQPREAMERVKETITKKHDTMLERIDRMKKSAILTELEGIYKKGLNLVDPSELTGTLKGKHIIDRQLQTVFKQAKKRISILTTEQGLRELHVRHYRILKKVTKRGVKLRILAPLKDSDIVRSLSEIAEVRHIKSPMGRIAFIDNEHMMLALTDDKSVHETQDVVLWASSPHAVEKFAEPYFNQLWNISGAK